MPQRSNLYTFGFAGVICVLCSVVLALAATALKPDQTVNARLDIVKNILSVVGYVNKASAPKDGLLVMPEKAGDILALFKKEFQVLLLNENNQPMQRVDIEKELTKLKYPARELRKLYIFELLKIFNSKKNFLARMAGQSLEKYDPGYKSLILYQPGGAQAPVRSYILPISGYGLWDMMYGYIAIKPDFNSVKGITFYEHKETPGLGGEFEKQYFLKRFIDKKIFDKDGKFVSVTVAKGKYMGSAVENYVDGVSGATLTGKGVNAFLKKDLSKYIVYFKLKREEQSKAKADQKKAGKGAGAKAAGTPRVKAGKKGKGKTDRGNTDKGIGGKKI